MSLKRSCLGGGLRDPEFLGLIAGGSAKPQRALRES
jgi:hypothetical protein